MQVESHHVVKRHLAATTDLPQTRETRLHPQAPPLPVLICEPPKALVLGNNMDYPGTWGFYLKEVDGGATRLVIRGRGDWKPGMLNWLGAHVLFEPAHFIMERKMMLGIKSRAESLRREEALTTC